MSEEPFFFESIPSNLLSFVIEKMTFLEFATFNGCSKFSSKICEGIPESTKFPFYAERFCMSWGLPADSSHALLTGSSEIKLETVPENIRIVCGTLDILHAIDLDPIWKYEVSAERLYIRYDREDAGEVQEVLQITKPSYFFCGGDNTVLALEEVRKYGAVMNSRFPLRAAPENVRFTCKRLFIDYFNDDSYVELVRRYGIKAEEIDLGVSHLIPEYLQKLIQLVEPKFLCCRSICDNPILNLAEVQKLPGLRAFCGDGIDDSTLLQLQAETMWIWGLSKISLAGITSFIRQWLAHKRAIDLVSIRSSGVKFDQIRQELKDVCTEDPENPTILFVCRSENHRDCIRLHIDNCDEQVLKFLSGHTCPKIK